MQHVAKVIRHRHKRLHYINDDLKEVEEDVQFKILFSDPAEMLAFDAWCVKNKGKHDYDKENSEHKGKMPKPKEFKTEDEYCWCDIYSFYLSNVAGYKFHSTIHPYKGEVYVKEEPYEWNKK